MPATYEPIATTTLGSAASTITFSSIPSTYTDLRIVLVTVTSTTNYPRLRYNSDSGANYSDTYLYGNGSSATSGRNTGNTKIVVPQGGSTSTTVPTFFTYDIFSYAGSTNKTCLITCQTDQNGSGNVERNVGLWRSTSAITTIELGLDNAGNYNSGTTATLYGIKAA
jgi:hypothetical protein